MATQKLPSLQQLKNTKAVCAPNMGTEMGETVANTVVKHLQKKDKKTFQ